MIIVALTVVVADTTILENAADMAEVSQPVGLKVVLSIISFIILFLLSTSTRFLPPILALTFEIIVLNCHSIRVIQSLERTILDLVICTVTVEALAPDQVAEPRMSFATMNIMRILI